MELRELEKKVLEELKDKLSLLNTMLLPLLPGYYPTSGAKSINEVDEIYNLVKQIFRDARK